MANRHFTANGYPDLPLLAAEISGFFKEYDILAPQMRNHILSRTPICDDPLNFSHDKYLRMLFDGGVPHIPADICDLELYIVGGQAEVMPKSYKRGNHDLDIKVVNPFSARIRKVDSERVIELLRYALNGPEDGFAQKLLEDVPLKHHYIDLTVAESTEEIYPPNLRISPCNKEVNFDVFTSYR